MTSLEAQLVEAAESLAGTISAAPLVPEPKAVLNWAQLAPGVHHVCLAIWDPVLPDGRAIVLLGADEEVNKQCVRLDLIHQLFPRGILLTERHRRATPEGQLQSRLQIKTDQRNARPIALDDPSWPMVTVSLSSSIGGNHLGCWDQLVPRVFLTQFESVVQDLMRVFKRSNRRQERNAKSGAEANWHHVIDAGRSLREEFRSDLRYRRRVVADLALDQIKEVADLLADWDQVNDRRRRELPDLKDAAMRELPELNEEGADGYYKRRTLSLFGDIEALDDFLCFLQGLRCYFADNKHLTSWFWQKDNDKDVAIALFAIGDSPDDVMPQEEDERARIFLNLHKSFFAAWGRALRGAVRNQNNGSAADEEPAEWKKSIHPTVRREIQKLLGVLSEREYKRCAQRIVLLSRTLAETQMIHEGQELRYRLVYAPSGKMWEEIEDVLSFEATQEHTRALAKRSKHTLHLARFLGTHWSIFQPERVFAMFDTMRAGTSAGLPRIQRIVRVRPPEAWSGLESEVMNQLARRAFPCLVATALGDGKVRLCVGLNGSAEGHLLWNTRRNTVEELQAEDPTGEPTPIPGIEDRHKRSLRIMRTVLAEVSEASGEGALLIVVDDKCGKEVVEQTCVEMDDLLSQMAWRKMKRFPWIDRTLLRAMLILDGATVLEGTEDGGMQLRPRVVVYPMVACGEHGATAFAVTSSPTRKGLRKGSSQKCTCLSPDPNALRRTRAELPGKGSRTHGAANIGMLLDCQSQEYSVFSVSADGGMKSWPPPPKKGGEQG